MLQLARLHVRAWVERDGGGRTPLDVERTVENFDDRGNPFAIAWLLLQLSGEVNAEIARRARELNLQPLPTEVPE